MGLDIQQSEPHVVVGEMSLKSATFSTMEGFQLLWKEGMYLGKMSTSVASCAHGPNVKQKAPRIT